MDDDTSEQPAGPVAVEVQGRDGAWEAIGALGLPIAVDERIPDGMVVIGDFRARFDMGYSWPPIPYLPPMDARSLAVITGLS